MKFHKIYKRPLGYFKRMGKPMAAACNYSTTDDQYLVWNYWQGTNAPIWYTWAQNGTNATATSPWVIWNYSNGTGATVIWPIQSNGAISYQTYEETPETYLSSLWAEWAELNETQREERLAILRQKQEALEKQEQEQRRIQWEWAEAGERARQLLESVLDEEQQKTLYKDNVIYLTSEKRKRYRLKRDGSVHLLDDEGKNAVASFCIHPTEQCPTDDHVAAKVLYLKYAEADFERIANRTPLGEFRRAG